MGINPAAIQTLVSTYTTEADHALVNVRTALGDINPNAPAQVRKAVQSRFNVNLPSADESTLKTYQGSVPVLVDLLAYRQALKKKATAESWLQAAGTDHRVHPSFNSLAAATGG